MSVGNDHQFCGDSIVLLIAEVQRLRAQCAELMNVMPGAIALSPAVEALLVVDSARVQVSSRAGGES